MLNQSNIELRTRNQDLEAQLELLRGQLEESNDRNRHLVAELERANGTIAQLNNDVLELQEQLRNLELQPEHERDLEPQPDVHQEIFLPLEIKKMFQSGDFSSVHIQERFIGCFIPNREHYLQLNEGKLGEYVENDTVSGVN